MNTAVVSGATQTHIADPHLNATKSLTSVTVIAGHFSACSTYCRGAVRERARSTRARALYNSVMRQAVIVSGDFCKYAKATMAAADGVVARLARTRAREFGGAPIQAVILLEAVLGS